MFLLPLYNFVLNAKPSFKLWIGYFALFLCSLSSCIPTKRIGQHQTLLYSQEVKGNKQASNEDLESFYRQTPNQGLIIKGLRPYLWAYHIGEKFYDRSDSLEYVEDLEQLRKERKEKLAKYEGEDPKLVKQRQKLKRRYDKKVKQAERKVKEGNWLMRSVGEPPVIFDSTSMLETASQMKLFLQQRGFFYAEIIPEVKQNFKKKTTRVTYSVQEGRPHYLHRIKYSIEDSSLAKTVFADTLNSLCQTASIYNADKISQERERLTRHLKNKGYYGFLRDYIFIEVDTLLETPYTANLRFIITNPENQNAHERFEVNSVRVFVDQGSAKNTEKTSVIEHDGIEYVFFGRQYAERILNTKIRMRPNALYSLENDIQTQNGLASLGMFKFISIRNDTTGNKFRTDIFLNSYPRMNVSLEGGAAINVSESVPGPFFTVAVTNRNTFGGCETLEATARGAIEIQSGLAGLEEGRQTFRTQNYNFNLGLSIPQFVFPFSQKFKDRIGRYNPRTRMQIGYAYTERPEYERANVQGKFAYQWTGNRFSHYEISPFILSINNTLSIQDSFRTNLNTLFERGNNLILSFGRSYITSFGGSYTYNNNRQQGGAKENKQRHAFYLRFNGEMGISFTDPFGLNLILGDDDIVSDSLYFFRYARTNLDLRYYLRTDAASRLAFRFHTGVAFPLGNPDVHVLPYEKYFFIGGGNSLRAWRPRRLGPGSQAPNRRSDGSFEYLFEQPGEVLIEASVEWRKHLFGFIEGALFIDAGNIWRLGDNIDSEAAFELNSFWEEIAVGTGFGVRLDFSFLIVRSDFGIKMINPAEEAGKRFVLGNFFSKPLQNTTLNIAVGYPF
ncbi:MAG: BamA/TamA family outer membrane protein [Bernardetiaceae bacterium]|nr:BamA/TamA family outer membrane protein [Bernardetiaceae bacterium]